MALRDLVYVAQLYTKYIQKNCINIFSTKRIGLPTPRIDVFYAGSEDCEGREDGFSEGRADGFKEGRDEARDQHPSRAAEAVRSRAISVSQASELFDSTEEEVRSWL